MTSLSGHVPSYKNPQIPGCNAFSKAVSVTFIPYGWIELIATYKMLNAMP